MRAHLLASLAFALSGCTCGIALCNADSDCGLGGSCDPSTGVCVLDEGAGGPGGGSTTTLKVLVPGLAERPPVGSSVYEDSPPAWRRSEELFVWLEASGPLTHPSLKVEGVDAVAAADAACLEPCEGSCYCFAVDLSKPPLPGLRGAFSLLGAGLDPDGKAVTTSGSLNVTRLYWRRALGSSIRTTPAIGVDGTVYVGTSSLGAGQSGSVVAISAGGKPQWSRQVGDVEASVLLAAPGAEPQRLFVGSSATTARVTAFDATGVQLAQCVLSKEAGLEASPALIAGGAAFYANKSRELIAFRPASTPACELKQTSGDVRYPDSLVASGQAVFLVDEKPSVHRYDLTGAGWKEASEDQWPGAPSSNYRNRGLAVPGSGTLVGAGETAPGGTVFQAAVGDGFRFDFGFSPARLSTSASGPVVTSAGLVLVGTAAGIAVVSSQDAQLAAGDRISNSPALGEGGRLYALAENGALSEWTYADGKPHRSWTAPLDPAAAPAFEASPALDCARTAAGVLLPGRPGILYAAGRTGTLFAIIVDAHGLDTTAQWPKYQKDPRNSGAADTGLQEFRCP